jgi:hypothetical protein
MQVLCLQAAVQLLGLVIEQSIVAGLDMEKAGAVRPAHLPPIPPAGAYDASDEQAWEKGVEETPKSGDSGTGHGLIA